MISRLLAKIPAHLPKAWVMGILLWCLGLALMVPGTIFGVLHWHAALMTILSLMFIVFVGFMVCILWLMVERMFGRVTPWRRHA
jgi:hypothetical protein